MGNAYKSTLKTHSLSMKFLNKIDSLFKNEDVKSALKPHRNRNPCVPFTTIFIAKGLNKSKGKGL